MDINQIIDFESGELDEDSTVQMFQSMINDGSVWHLQSSYGRIAMELLKDGKCMLGEVSYCDPYGNKIPSRYEVQPGSFGSEEYQKKYQGGK
jgi:hypothetical protein